MVTKRYDKSAEIDRVLQLDRERVGNHRSILDDDHDLLLLHVCWPSQAYG